MTIIIGAWKPRLNFIGIHYAWILFCSLLAFPVMYSYGNLTAVDALFFGCSGSTESGLNTVDVKDLKTYQQVYIYVIPIITNLMFINAMVVPVRLFWFRRLLKQAGPANAAAAARDDDEEKMSEQKVQGANQGADQDQDAAAAPSPTLPKASRSPTITFYDRPSDAKHQASEQHRLRPAPRQSDIDQPDPRHGVNHQDNDVSGITNLPSAATTSTVTCRRAFSDADDTDDIKPVQRTQSARLRHYTEGPVLHAAKSIEKAAASAFILGDARPRPVSRSRSRSRNLDLPKLSRYATVGRNSNFYNLTEADRELLGGIEYRALKILLKFVFGYFIGLHVLGVVCLLPWIHNAPAKYTDWLEESSVGKTWWAFYSAQTMVDNLGFTLTPDSMATFKDATWPMLVMTFLAFAGNTCYPVLLRLIIWIVYKMVPRNSQSRETLQFLLDHPRRCYTLLFPSRPTWILFYIIFALNFIDVVLIIVLDLDNPAVNDLPMGPRILSALFQAASARHTGTSTLNLANVNPAVQFSLLTMMYIAIFPIAISVRASNTYQDRALGIWSTEHNLDEHNGISYVLVHVRNQLTFDLWYIFLGTFLICIAESKRIMDLDEPSFSVFPVLFEVTSAYGNVGLSLGGPFGYTSMVGHYTVFSKVVVCAMMIRGRHRGLPYALDRAITLPNDTVLSDTADDPDELAKGSKLACVMNTLPTY
ncbi:low-affinity potassium transport protein [Verticillium dahliae VdLs.17]|uniref:Potassium transport protein n=1 Tax=Verticillium dahliae (strain VdLs.17 / ATCC MYA-4575 / FGSC 10137) TaxID=498257 RepID=G2X362_VERDV|nr:low-affinity potassium transport protein [Verticillium dahliae VdLs.17]EGY23409.1 low-affinity potassium transport protein [Verticillium dahliae VdLs.17]